MNNDANDRGGCILVGVFPGQPDTVVREAARLAARLGTDLVCAHADDSGYMVQAMMDGTVSSLSFDPDLPAMDTPEFDADLAQHLAGLLDGSGIRWSTREVSGEPALALGQLAEDLDASLIVVGTRRPGVRGGLQEFFTGSMAANLAHRQRRPVVVVPVHPLDAGTALPWETAS
ncbi:universal stress protein [Cryobacterium tepidiphilum]|jgi:nucleotide-binding universal stress UspA family protein|uniref:Universal stress protein n=1 Tax=Cryobacterium tepidiphilum TaxID=2486026 RepID=A0A3M8LDD2_9MICO|nr:universal stress protein [Cryobacterium tepidiphilum]RNE62488.1 universal stress protein [Cryobacterium tepidiphilum]